MPRRAGIDSILLIGSGPIVIGHACEFDYSDIQMCKTLRQARFRIILVNSNPATIMMDPEMVDAIQAESLTVPLSGRDTLGLTLLRRSGRPGPWHYILAGTGRSLGQTG